ncbi:MAG: hypothetical protein DHS20C01_14150 [marine bacterium B5-7]|nr:MAG: hypothetical protein DHS20C01_14150 [marine bacterium B5-7]
MNFEKVVFAFFILLALTLNFGFFLGVLDDPTHHHAFELFAALIVSLVATVMKFGDRTPVGSVLLASSLVADLQLIAAALVWGITLYGIGVPLSSGVTASIVSLSGGALLANIVSVVLLIMETFVARR